MKQKQPKKAREQAMTAARVKSGLALQSYRSGAHGGGRRQERRDSAKRRAALRQYDEGGFLFQ